MIMYGLWIPAISLLAIAMLTEPYDGHCARAWGSSNRLVPFAKNGKQSNEFATAAISIVVPGACFLYTLVAMLNSWGGVNEAWQVALWLVLIVWFSIVTVILNKGKELLVPDKAEKMEVYQAWFTGLIIIICGFWLATMSSLNLFAYLMIAAWLSVLIYAASDDRFSKRINERPNYRGTKESLTISEWLKPW